MTTTPPSARPAPRRPRAAGRATALVPLVALGALALGLAACGSSSSSSTSTTASPPTSTATSTTHGSSSSSSTATTAPGTPTCRTASLAVSLGSPNGSAGAVHYGLTFKNTGAAACTLFGFPGVSFLDSAGHAIGDPAQRQGGTPTTTTVGPGANAYASIAVTDPGIPPCTGGTAATQVLVYPPGETHAASVAAPSGLQVCSSPNTSSYVSSTVTPVSATAI